MEFEWDPTKESRNLEKHGISFVAAARVLESGATLRSASDHGDEQRWVAVGPHPETGRIIAVVYAMRDARYRIISARRARKHEETQYREWIEREATGRGCG